MFQYFNLGLRSAPRQEPETLVNSPAPEPTPQADARRERLRIEPLEERIAPGVLLGD